MEVRETVKHDEDVENMGMEMRGNSIDFMAPLQKINKLATV